MRTAPLTHGRVALCVCAYNEEEVIRAKVQNMLAMRDAVPDLQILVYVDAASDRARRRSCVNMRMTCAW